ncbi:MAG: ribosomal protein S18-alanine N-acetyltransferase [Bacillota bacterium]|nr:ribosomal protein S18-alanine N-acetyltransferase [Bacillota bacterium]
MQYSIVNAESRHLEQILDIEKRCFSVPFTREQLLSQMPDDSHVFIIAESECGNVMGYVGMMYVLDEGYISNVAVAEEYRRIGVADRLINELEAVSEKLGLCFMTLEVRASNGAARALYKKHGFTDVGRRKNYYTLPTEDAILMTSYLK